MEHCTELRELHIVKQYGTLSSLLSVLGAQLLKLWIDSYLRMDDFDVIIWRLSILTPSTTLMTASAHSYWRRMANN